MFFFKKVFVSFFPNINSVNYSIMNSDTFNMLNFRRYNFSSLSFKLTEFHAYKYNFGVKQLNRFINIFVSTNSINYKIGNHCNKYLSVYLYMYIFRRNYYRFFSYLYFKRLHNFNVTKINFMFIYYFTRNWRKRGLEVFDMKRSSDWYNFHFGEHKYFNKYPHIWRYVNIYLSEYILKSLWLFKKYNEMYMDALKNLSNVSSDRFEKINAWSQHFMLLYLPFNFNKINNIFVNNNFLVKLKSKLPSNYSDRSTNKYILNLTLNNYLIFFLRKNKIFNKGRYSRNRQTYRTGFYWSLWVNILVIYGLHFVFYRFVFSFGYVWLTMVLFFGLFVISRSFKYNYHNYNYILGDFYSVYVWCGYVFKNSFYFVFLLFKNIISFFSFINVFKLHQLKFFKFSENFFFESFCVFSDKFINLYLK